MERYLHHSCIISDLFDARWLINQNLTFQYVGLTLHQIVVTGNMTPFLLSDLLLKYQNESKRTNGSWF